MNNSQLKIAYYLNIRILLMILFQVMTFILLKNKESPFELSGFYWSIQLTLVNLLLLVMMVVLSKKKNMFYFSFFKQMNKENSLYSIKIIIPLVILAMVPNILLSILIYGDSQIGTAFLIHKIPLIFMIINLTIFPILQGLVEIPFYFSFIMPRIKNLSSNKWLYIGLPVIFLSFQHAFMPLKFDLTYMVYRSLMFFPFAIFIGVLLNRKKEILPYLVILHILMNASLFMMYFVN